jgi:DMSO/TMAO reductase YedYZ molybdopterin-dependent catalytic subunit
MKHRTLTRRQMLLRGTIAFSGLALAACDRLTNSPSFVEVLQSAERLTYRGQRALIGADALAHEFTAADLSPTFRSNGTSAPDSVEYQRLAQNQFQDWQLKIDGLVSQPVNLSLAALRLMPSRTQITRHDCVEGWSAIGQWTGVPLANVLNVARLVPRARFVVFHCADSLERGEDPYYESIDLVDAFHPQTILAYELNGRPLPVANGAPLRLRVERQLGYKHAKYVMRIQVVEDLDSIQGGKGGYWEDRGYEWYAGI